jgi:ABC-type branched-subunit amino acid transport system substrate-binding protein
MHNYIFILLFLIGGISRAQVPPRYQSSVEKTFSTALRFFESGKYRNAYVLYDSLSRIEPIHQRTTASLLMAAKCLQKMKSYRSSIVLLKDFLSRFPMSSYIADANYSLAVSSILNQDHRSAGKYLLTCLESTKGEDMRSRVVGLFDALADYRYDLGDLKDLVSFPDSLVSKDLAWLNLAEKYAEAGKVEESRDILTGILARTKISVFHNRCQKLYEDLGIARPKAVGVVLPAADDAQPPSIRLLASEIAEGLTYANEEYMSDVKTTDRWSLDIRKVNQKTEESVETVRAMARDQNVGVIVGPLFPDAAAKCALIAAEENVPLIVPTATVAGNVGRNNVFQLIPGDEMCGKLLARYAVEQERLYTFAILSSEDDRARIYAESFSNEAKRLGAKILVHEQYENGVSDLREQFMNIRKAGFGRLSEPELSENTEKPMNKIDGILLSIGKREEIGVVASQLFYYNIQSALLGNGIWDDQGQLQKNRSYLEGLIFGTEELYDESSKEIHEFKQNYYQRMKKYPSRYSALGYDIMMLLLDLIENGVRTRADLAKALSEVQDYRGIRSAITFSAGGVNSDMFILEFRDGELRKIAEVSLK